MSYIELARKWKHNKPMFKIIRRERAKQIVEEMKKRISFM